MDNLTNSMNEAERQRLHKEEQEKKRLDEWEKAKLLNEAVFTQSRSILMGVSLLIVVMGMNASIIVVWLEKAGLTVEQLLSLRGLFFFVLILYGLRYYQSAVASKQWAQSVKDFTPYFRQSLCDHSILRDVYRYGRSEYSERAWDQFEDESFFPDYRLISYDDSTSTKLVKIDGSDWVSDRERKKSERLVVFCRIVAFCKFSLEKANVRNFIWPIFLAFIAFLEVTGIAKISTFLLWLGQVFSGAGSEYLGGLFVGV